MPVPSVMADLSVTAASNSPAATDTLSVTDDYIRALAGIVRTTNAKGTDVASNTTTNIGAATAEFIDVTGTTTITAFDTIAAGIVRTVRFTGALTLTHNATSLILPGGANITTVNGDTAMFRSLGSGNWKCIFYPPTTGTGSGAFVRATSPTLVTPVVTTSLTTGSTTFALLNDTATTVNFAGAATTVSMGAGAASTLNANFTTAINLNSAAVTSNQTTVAVFNTNATTVNAFGAASTALNIGNASAAAAFPGGISIPTGKSVTGAGTATVTGFTTVSATNVTGTLTTAAQPNITSTGALTGGSIGVGFGTINIGSNALTAGAISGTGSTGVYALEVDNPTGAAGSNYGLRIKAGRNGSDAAVYVTDYSDSVAFFRIDSTGAATHYGNSLTAGTVGATGGIYPGATQTAAALLSQASSGAGTTTTYIGNQTINTTSDERVKSNIRPLDDGLSIVNGLVPIEYDQDVERPIGSNRHYVGFGARQAQKIAPWTVNTQGDTGLPWQMRQEFLMAPAVRAIQQIDARLQALEARLQ